MGLAGLAAALVVAGAVVLVVRGLDVRLVLLVAAVALAALGGDVAPVVREFLGTFSNEKFVVPICSAMGFAYVLRHTGCERHLVLLLVRPLRRVRGLLIPGVVLVGFVVNIPVISQTSTAVCIGAVVVPLMRAAGYSFPTVGACLLLGSSVGGELLNPGAPELNTVFDKTKVSTVVQARGHLPPVLFVQLAVATAAFWALSLRWERRRDPSPGPTPEKGGEEEFIPSPPSLIGKGSGGLGSEPPTPERVNVVKACVPLVPLVLLFLTGPPFNAIHVGQGWLVPFPPASASAAVAGGAGMAAADLKPNAYFSSRLVGLAMLVGVLAAAAATPGRAGGCVKLFFEGAGYGFTHVVSLIVVANCFGKGVEQVGLAQALGDLIARAPNLLVPLAGFVPLAFAAVSGSGMASTQSLYGFFYGPALTHGANPVDIGAVVSLGAAAGRTMSPVAAVVLMCGSLTGTNPFVLVGRVAGPLLLGMTVVVALRMMGVI